MQPVHTDPDRFFDPRHGLQARTLAQAALDAGPLGIGPDGLWHRFDHGVWVPDQHELTRRITHLLGNRFRTWHADLAATMITAHPDRVHQITGDPHPDVINFANGMLRWDTGELLPHAPEYLSTVQLPVSWDPDARCPGFDRFLEQIAPADGVGLLWQLTGYLMLNGNPLQKAVMLVGSGANGKSKLLSAWEQLLGARNVSNVTLDGINSGRFNLADLYGRLANFAGDIDATYQRSTAGLKMVTGTDTIRAERKYRDAFTFTPWATHVFSANKIPGSADTSHGYLRRWIVVPFPHTFTGDTDPLASIIPAELPGIAAAGVLALRAVMAGREFVLPDSAVEAKDEFARAIDPVREWAHEALVTGEGFLPRSVALEAYRTWCLDNGHKPLGRNGFHDRMRGAGMAEHRDSAGGRYYLAALKTQQPRRLRAVS